jgi:hypothetical protein
MSEKCDRRHVQTLSPDARRHTRRNAQIGYATGMKEMRPRRPYYGYDVPAKSEVYAGGALTGSGQRRVSYGQLTGHRRGVRATVDTVLE